MNIMEEIFEIISCDKSQQSSCHVADRLQIDWLSMVLRLRQHNIGYTADRLQYQVCACVCCNVVYTRN